MPETLSDAWKLLDGKVSVPSEMLTAEWRAVPQWIRERQFYMAGVYRAEILEEFRKEATLIANGERGLEESRKRLEQFLATVNYQPTAGEEGTIKDLRSMRRIQVSLRTNVQLLQGWGQKERGLKAMAAFPAWELVRFESRRQQREWAVRFARAGGKLINGRIIALKGSDVWRKLGHDEPDTLGVDYPPFAWGSGMGWRAVSRGECEALGLLEGWSPPQAQPVASPNESMQTTPRVSSPDIKAALADKLQGLAQWNGDILVFADPNGTRPYTAEKLAQVVTAKLPDGFEQMQAKAVERHVNAGLMLGELKDDFLRFLNRTAPLESGTPVYRGEAYRTQAALRDRLAELASPAAPAVSEIAQSWSLDAAVAAAFATGKGLLYRLILVTRSHGTLRPIYQTAELLVPSAAGQKEVVALLGTRFRIVGKPAVTREGRTVEARVEVEEVMS